jgi:hypothetical protein
VGSFGNYSEAGVSDSAYGEMALAPQAAAPPLVY